MSTSVLCSRERSLAKEAAALPTRMQERRISPYSNESVDSFKRAAAMRVGFAHSGTAITHPNA